MTRRWAPAAAAAAVVVLVAVITLAVGRPGDRDAPQSVAPATSSPSAEPSTDPDTSVSSSEPPSAKPSAAAPVEPQRTAAADEPASPGPSSQGSPAPLPPPRPSPAPSPTAQAPAPSGRAALPFDAAYGTDEPNEVIVQYGDSSGCPHENVTKAVRESADTVVVTLTADAQPPERACTADYRQMLVPVALSRPLGTRRVIDAATGKEVEVDRSCSRPFPNPPPPRDCTS